MQCPPRAITWTHQQAPAAPWSRGVVHTWATIHAPQYRYPHPRKKLEVSADCLGWTCPHDPRPLCLVLPLARVNTTQEVSMLSAASFSHATHLSRSLELREKIVKVLAYSTKLAAHLHGSSRLAAASKQLSAARKVFSLLHWVRHVDDASDALGESGSLRALALLELAAALVVDLLGDASTLVSLRLLPLSPRLAERLEWCAAAVDAVHALVALGAGAVRASRIERLQAAAPQIAGAGAKAGADPKVGSTDAKLREKLQLARLAIVKYACDLLKASHAAGLRGLRGGGVPLPLALFAGLASGVISSHKVVVKLNGTRETHGTPASSAKKKTS